MPRKGFRLSKSSAAGKLPDALIAPADSRPGRRARATDDSENLVLAHDEQFLAVDLDFGATVLAEQDAVAGLHVQRLACAVLQVFAFADGDDLALLRLLLRRVRDDDAAAHLLALFNAFHDHAVVQWLNIDRHNFSQSPYSGGRRFRVEIPGGWAVGFS